MANTRLTRTNGTPTSQQKFTYSSWVKRSALGEGHITQGFYSNSTNYNHVNFLNTDRLDFINYEGSTTARKITTAKFRDVSAWYHICVAVDTTLGTANDRIKMYVNGVLQTVFDTNSAPSQNANLGVNLSTQAVGVGEGGGIGYLQGYLAESVYIDGQQLDPTSFGEFDEDSGIWKPIDVSGLTFGTNGFYLDFENSGALGADVSGNTNNFTVNNLTAIDQSTDTCTNNFATWNPIIKTYGTQVFSNGNTTSLNATNEPAWAHAIATLGASTGKYYWEIKVSGSTPWIWTGIISEAVDVRTQYLYNSNAGTFLYGNNGNKYVNASATSSFFATLATNDIVSVALNLDDNKITFYKNGTATPNATALDLPTNLSSTTVFPATTIVNGASIKSNFGNGFFGTTAITTNSGNGYAGAEGASKFNYQPPSGYSALNTKGLNQ